MRILPFVSMLGPFPIPQSAAVTAALWEAGTGASGVTCHLLRPSLISYSTLPRRNSDGIPGAWRGVGKSPVPNPALSFLSVNWGNGSTSPKSTVVETEGERSM